MSSVPRSLTLGRRTSSSIIWMMPRVAALAARPRRFLAESVCGAFSGCRSSRSSTGWLSMYGMCSNEMPSASYSPSSAWKVVIVKLRCSFSLAKLMQSCSNELVSKISKPKMSSTPMNLPSADVPTEWRCSSSRPTELMRLTIQSKSPA